MKNTNIPKLKSRISYTQKLFISSGFIILNERLITEIGLFPALLLSKYVDKERCFYITHPENYGWFFLIHDDISKQLGIKKYTIIKAKKVLLDNKLIICKKKGNPAKEYIKVLHNKIAMLLDDEFTVNPDPTFSGGLDSLDPTFSGGQYTPTLEYNKENKEYKENKEKENLTKPLSFKQVLAYFPQDWQDNETFHSMLQDFYNHRREISTSKKDRRLKHTSTKRFMNMFSKHDIDTVIQAMDTSIRNGWQDVFINKDKYTTKKESGVLNKINNKDTPQEIINKHFSGYEWSPKSGGTNDIFANAFYTTNYQPAINWLDNPDNPDIVNVLLDFHKDIIKYKRKYLSSELVGKVSGPFLFIEDYIIWLNKNSWINDKSLKVFDMNNVLLSKFRRAYAKQSGGLQLDHLTGESYLKD